MLYNSLVNFLIKSVIISIEPFAFALFTLPLCSFAATPQFVGRHKFSDRRVQSFAFAINFCGSKQLLFRYAVVGAMFFHAAMSIAS